MSNIQATAVVLPMLARHAETINGHHSAAVDAARSILTHAVAAGELLIGVKRALQHGEFGPWCRANLAFSHNTAAEYMRLAKFQDRLKFDPDMSLREALRSISPKPQAAPPPLDADTAEKMLKLHRMTGNPNPNEASVAAEMLEKLAARFGMSSAAAVSAAEGSGEKSSQSKADPDEWKRDLCHFIVRDMLNRYERERFVREMGDMLFEKSRTRRR